MSRDPWPENSPESLFSICLDYCAEILGKAICGPWHQDEVFEGLNLSHIVNQQLFHACVRAGVLCKKGALSLFQGQQQMKLKRLNLSTVMDLMDEDLEGIMYTNSPTELHLASDLLSPRSLRAINRNSGNLVSLHLSNAKNILPGGEDADAAISHTHLNCPYLRFLTLNKLMPESTKLLNVSLSCMTDLTSLDISNSDVDISQMENLRCLLNLQILKLHNVTFDNLESAFRAIAEVKSLRYLKMHRSEFLSQSLCLTFGALVNFYEILLALLQKTLLLMDMGAVLDVKRSSYFCRT